jgi:hypothetical protein
MTDQELALRALKEADFGSTTHIKSVWHNPKYDVSSLHESERNQIFDELDRLKNSEDSGSPLGMVLVGSGGTGKTHLLSKVRKQAFTKGIGFVLADMGNVRDFWQALLQGYVSSLQENEASGIPQFKGIIKSLIELTGNPTSVEQLAQEESAQVLDKETQAILAALVRKERQLTIKFRDVIRSLLLLNSNNVITQGIGDNWLRGFGIDDSEKEAFGFSRTSMERSSIVEGLSWLMSLRGPSVLALDQLDSVVGQARAVAGVETDALSKTSEEQSIAIAKAKLIIENIAEGLSNLYEKTARTLVIVSCIEGTWTTLKTQTIGTVRGRFREPMPLSPVLNRDTAKEIVEQRLKEAYERTNFSPPYPTWPFSEEFFNSAVRYYPREILRRCHEHREECLAQKQITVLDSFTGKPIIPPVSPPLRDYKKLDQAFAAAKEQVNPADAFEEYNEDKVLGKWLQTACYCLVKENPTSNDVVSTCEVEFSGHKNYPPLHARISLVFKNEGEREKYLCLRALQKSHHNAYQPRLKAAITESGIDKALEASRRLVLVRTQPIPGGAKNQELTRQFREAGGLFGHPSEDELRTLGALHQLKDDETYPYFAQWLCDRRPVSRLPFIQDSVTWLFEGVTDQKQNSDSEADSDTPEAKEDTEADFSNQRTVTKVSLGNLPVGVRLVGQQTKETISIRAEDLTKHAVVLAGSGSGKTVLVKRIVEEAALMGIPSIVIDGANDLARLGDRWATPPESWQDEDRQKAAQYHQNTQVIIWTPGREAANPLNLNPLPDFPAVVNDPDELNQAIDMARDSLEEIVASGKSESAKKRRGVLRSALEYFAQNGSGSLEDFATLLSDLPMEAGGGISDPQKKAQEMADLLNAEISNNPLLRQSGVSLDPAALFGLSGANKTRISVINFFGLAGLPQQQQFLNQLAMTLFTWIKKNPAPVDRPLRGLLVIDEAKDFVPSGSSTSCKASIIRLAAQARKYGLGLIFATQAPKSIDHNIIANCSTQFYGKANSPASIQVMQEQLNQRGSSGQDIPKLQTGQFYAVSERLTAPVKILAPLCLSYHPPTPLGDMEVMQRAIESRNAICAKN